MALGIRHGGRRYDVRTVDALKATLLGVRSIVYAKEGAGGLYFADLAARLGLADALNAKTTYAANGEEVARTVARGAADIGVQPLSEILPHADLEVLATFPPSVEGYAVMVGAVAAAGGRAAAARQLLAFLVSPPTLPVLAQKGMTRQ